MHREIRDHVEAILAGTAPEPVSSHLKQCAECQDDIAAMSRQAAMLRQLRVPNGQELDPAPGFYARIMERIEAQNRSSIWSLFIESAFGRRIAAASIAFAVLLGVYLVTSERSAEEPIVAGQQTVQALPLSQPASMQDQFGNASGYAGAPSGTLQITVDGPVNGMTPAEVRMFMQQQQAAMQQMQDMINEMNRTSSDDQVLVNLATYREQ